MKHIHTQQTQDGEHRVRQKKLNNFTEIFNKQERNERHGVNKNMFSGDGREGSAAIQAASKQAKSSPSSQSVHCPASNPLKSTKT
jgi:hypothetical protein